MRFILEPNLKVKAEYLDPVKWESASSVENPCAIKCLSCFCIIDPCLTQIDDIRCLRARHDTGTCSITCENCLDRQTHMYYVIAGYDISDHWPGHFITNKTDHSVADYDVISKAKIFSSFKEAQRFIDRTFSVLYQKNVDLRWMKIHPLNFELAKQ